VSTHRDSIQITTGAGVEVRNITSLVHQFLKAGPYQDGLLNLCVQHTTCALAVNEDEAGLIQDLERMAGGLLDPLKSAGPFRHDRIDNNAQAHLTASLLGPALTLPFSSGRMVLGTWQNVLLVECDGPRTRRIELTVVG
jgi:secondary thiamine-phosphate synthase enzyme